MQPGTARNLSTAAAYEFACRFHRLFSSSVSLYQLRTFVGGSLRAVGTAVPCMVVGSPHIPLSSIMAVCSFRLLRLLLVLLATFEDLEMSGLLGKKLFGRANEAGGAFLLDLVLLDQRRLLGLDNAGAGLGASSRRPLDVLAERRAAKRARRLLPGGRGRLGLFDCALSHDECDCDCG